jgi:hypothetical protein
MHTQIVMDHTGDSRHYFNPDDYVEVLDAKRRFRELTEAGYTAAKKTGNGTSEVIRKFDPTAKETLFIPRLVGDLRRRAEEKGLSLLRSWLTGEQDEQWSRDSEFVVVGCDTGTRYRITNGTTMNVIAFRDER